MKKIGIKPVEKYGQKIQASNLILENIMNRRTILRNERNLGR
jgi:hypothetical protein